MIICQLCWQKISINNKTSFYRILRQLTAGNSRHSRLSYARRQWSISRPRSGGGQPDHSVSFLKNNTLKLYTLGKALHYYSDMVCLLLMLLFHIQSGSMLASERDFISFSCSALFELARSLSHFVTIGEFDIYCVIEESSNRSICQQQIDTQFCEEILMLREANNCSVQFIYKSEED